MADQFEAADKITALYFKVAMENRPAQRKGPSREYCLECDEPIPEARRLAAPGCEYCVSCKEEMEK